jgi:hypothetical protein
MAAQAFKAISDNPAKAAHTRKSGQSSDNPAATAANAKAVQDRVFTNALTGFDFRIRGGKSALEQDGNGRKNGL